MDTTNIFKKNLVELNNNKTIIVNEGGQHSSKTYSILQLIIFLCQITKGKLYTIVGESIPFLKVGAMRQFLEILNNEGIFEESKWNMTDRIYKLGSNTIEFRAYDTASKALGAKRDFLFVNEAINIPFDTFQNLEGRTSTCTFIDYNPSFEFYAHEKLIGKEHVGYVHSTYKDNSYLNPKIIETIERYKEQDPNRWRVMGQGLVGSNEGLIFSNWNIVDTFEKNEKVIYGLDFGFTNDPSTCVAICKQGDDIFIDEIIYGLGLTNMDISIMLEQNGVKKHRDLLICDSAEPKSIAELKQRGWYAQASVKGPDSIKQGIDVLKQHNLHVTRRSTNVIKELRQYSWLKDADGKFLNRPTGADHTIDAIRYAMSSLHVKKTSTKVRVL